MVRTGTRCTNSLGQEQVLKLGLMPKSTSINCSGRIQKRRRKNSCFLIGKKKRPLNRKPLSTKGTALKRMRRSSRTSKMIVKTLTSTLPSRK
jgi:hypothetical protein